MNAVTDALASLDATQKGQVLRWAAEVHGITGIGTGGKSRGPDPDGNKRRFETLADLCDAASPDSDVDRALVAGYWFQFVEGAPEFGSQQVNTQLKNLGFPVANITSAFDSLKNRDPALVLQLKKSGTSKQARKTYKLTVAGKQAVDLMIGQQ